MGINNRIREERRRDLIAATIAVIAECGQAGLTLGRVARAAGLAVGLVNFHFESKEKLLAAVFRHLGQEFDAVWRESVAAAENPRTRLAAAIAAYFDPRIFTAEKLAVWFAFWSDAGLRDSYRSTAMRFERRYIAAMARSAAAILPGSGKAKLKRAEVLIAPVIAMIDGYWLQAMIYGADFDRTAAITSAIAMMERQLRLRCRHRRPLKRL